MVSQLKREIARIDPNARRGYIREFEEEFGRFQEVSSYDDLVIACYKADLVYVGDFHALPSSQMFAAKLLGEVASRARHVVLAVEMVYGHHQRVLNRWMRDEIDDEEFRHRIRYELEWGYDWNSFRQVLDTAREYGLKVFGIDSAPRNGFKNIRKRDEHAAARIAAIFSLYPEATVFVVFGESHLASGHLPASVRRHLRENNLEKRSVRVLQNVEEIYWQLVENGQEHRDVVLLAKNTFSVFNASPIAKYESYRQMIHRWTSEQPDDDHLDLTPTVYTMIDTILKFLRVDKYRVPVRQNGETGEFLVDCFPEVYSEVDAPTFHRILESNDIARPEIADIKRRIARNGSCYIPRINSIFIGRFSLVHGGEEAAHFVNLALRGDLYDGDSERVSRVDQFYMSVIEEALGFFGSKLIDPSRNHFFETDLYRFHRKDQAFIEENTDYTYEQFNQIIRFILLHKKIEKSYRDKDNVPIELTAGIRTRSRRMFSVLTHELGYFLGQQLYDGYHSGKMGHREITRLFRKRFDVPGSALAEYLALVEKLPAGV